MSNFLEVVSFDPLIVQVDPTPGADGAQGRDGLSVATATVNGSGHLIIGLSDGSTIDAGLVSSGGTGTATNQIAYDTDGVPYLTP